MGMSPLRLRSKFYLSFGAVLLIGTLVAALMLTMLYRSSASYEQVLETDRRVSELALTLQAAKLRVSEALRGRLLHPYGDFGTQALESLAAAYRELRSAYAAIRRLAADPHLLATLYEIERLDQDRLNRIEGQILVAIEQQESAKAERLYFAEYVPARAEQQRRLDRLNDLASRRIAAAVERTGARSRLVSLVAAGLTLLLLVAGCLLSFYLTRSFERPIRRLTQTARAIVAGDPIRELSLDRRDELGEMAEDLNRMLRHLRRLNDDLADQVRWLRETKDQLSTAQEQLVRQEKMAALGQLVAGVAHELNNPISFVYSNAAMLKDSFAALSGLLSFYDTRADLPPAAAAEAARIKEDIDYDYLLQDVPGALEDCQEGARRVRDIVLNLRTFSRLDTSAVQIIDITENLESTVRLLGQFFRPDRVVLHRDYAELPKVTCFASQLSQVWMNLMVNAAQAMQSRGDLWVTTRREGDCVIVQLRDSGPGIPEAILGKIFDPFFTTKPVGEGTGLGLSIAHGIVERHAGRIEVESRVGYGVTVTVELPINGRDAAGPVPAEPAGVLADPVTTEG